MSATIQATLSTYRRRGLPSIPLPNLAPQLTASNADFYYGTRGKASRRFLLFDLCRMPNDTDDVFTSVVISIAGSFRSEQVLPDAARFDETEFFYVEEARAHEREAIGVAWKEVVKAEAESQGRPWPDTARVADWNDPYSYMLQYPEGAPLLFRRMCKLKVLGIPMRTKSGEAVMVTMFRRRDALQLICWVHAEAQTVIVTLDGDEGKVCLPKREDVDPRYRRRTS